MPDGSAIAERPEGREPLRTDPTARATEPQRGRSAGDADNASAYWRRREQTARALAARAVDQHIARIHLDMAERYAVLARNEDVAKPPK